MRVLFSTTAGTGHFGPLIPFAKACMAAGHTVAVAAPDRFAGAVTGAGFTTHLRFDEAPPELVGEVFRGISQPTFEEMNRVMVAEIYGRLNAQAALPALTKIISDWRPDVVIRETCEFGSLVAAERAGVAQLHVAITMGRIGPGFIGLLKTSLTELSTMAGLPPGRGAELLLQADTLTSVPAALDSGDLALGESKAEPATDGRGRIWRFRTDAPAEARLPAAWGNPDDPLVYVSYGSVTARQPEFAPIYQATLRALADLPIRVLMTTGMGLEPADLEPIPPNSHIEQWWPQGAVMADAAAVVGHGGFGTTMAALSAGAPQVVLPLFSFDQAVNARRVAEINAGIELPGGVGAVADLPAALGKVMDDPAFIGGARAAAAEIAALPDVSACMPILEQLATERTKGDLGGE
jgi:UDP:flavonoid glycosyltransferase YjiC (YdhE family)